MNKFYLLYVLLFLSVALPSLGQEREGEQITGFFLGISFSHFAAQIEKQTDYRFFFDKNSLETIRVNVSARENTLSSILDAIFQESEFSYHISKNKRIFIFPKGRFYSELSSSFWQKDKSLENTIDPEESLPQNENYLKRAYTRNKLWIIGEGTNTKEGNVTLTGTISSVENGQPLSGATIYEKESFTQAVSDDKGYFQLTLPKGMHTLYIRYLGDYEEQRKVNLLGNGRLDLQIEENILSLDEFVVSSESLSNIARPKMGVEEMGIATMQKLPAVLGEVDVLRSIIALPGVSTVGEASVGFNVRGGAADQNLVLYNNSTVYNPSHLFGFFSAFNAEMVEGITLHKAGIPIQHGGRLSSVLEVTPKYGNAESFQGKGGIGLLTSKMMVEGPIGEKTTFALGGRSTYSGWLMDRVKEKAGFRGGKADFYDLNLNVKHQLSPNNELKLNTYYSNDSFRFDADTLFSYHNLNLALEWTHYFNKRLESDISIGYDQYRFGMDGRQDEVNAFDFAYEVGQLNFRSGFRYELNEQHLLNFGFNSTLYDLDPGHITPHGLQSIVVPDQVNPERALETALYAGDRFEVNDKVALDAGIRYVLYQYLGPNSINRYVPGAPKYEGTITGVDHFEDWESIQTYQGPEYRISARYLLDKFSSLKLAYNTGRQFIHLLTNTSAIAPTDTWKLSDPHLTPQWGDQVSMGYYQTFPKSKMEFSVELYHRNMRNLLDFRSGSQLILNNEVEQAVLNTQGKAYGIEFLLKKEEGRVNGWLSYTYSRSLLRTAPEEQAERINRGEWYPSNFDQPHDVMLVANYELTKRVTPAINVAYHTGRPMTVPVARFDYKGSERVYFSDRNAYRIPDYFRIDFSLNLEGNHKADKPAHASWTIGVYNVLGRSNPFSVYFVPEDNIMKGYQLSIFARPFPFLTYNFKF